MIAQSIQRGSREMVANNVPFVTKETDVTRVPQGSREIVVRNVCLASGETSVINARKATTEIIVVIFLDKINVLEFSVNSKCIMITINSSCL